MRKVLSIILVAVLSLTLCACSQTNTINPNLDSALDEPMVMNMFYRNTLGADLESDNISTKTADQKAESLIETVENFADTLKPADGRSTYYVSATGDDSANGLTTATAKKTYGSVMSLLKSGDVVLFKRNDVFREKIQMVSGVSYGAYGQGIKPRFYGSIDAMNGRWEETEIKGVYKYNEMILYYSNIVFDNGRFVGKYVEDFDSITDSALNVYIAGANNYLYLYSPDGNPQDVFSSIEIVDNLDDGNNSPFQADSVNDNDYNTENVTLQNLCIMYSGTHCITPGKTKNFNVEGCVLGFAGGRDIFVKGEPPVGNAIELWGKVDTVSISNNYIFQCYDTGITHQGPLGSDSSDFRNITYNDNLIEYCVWGIESWYYSDSGTVYSDNINILDNIIRFSGYGWGSVNRVDKNVYSDIVLSLGNHSTNTTISGNLFDRSRNTSVKISNAPDKSQMNFTNNKILIDKNMIVSSVTRDTNIYTYKYGAVMEEFLSTNFGSYQGNDIVFLYSNRKY